MNALEEFSLDLDAFQRRTVPEAHLDLQKKIALDLLSRVVARTPVGNPDLWQHPAPAGYVGGRARANWQVAVNIEPGDAALARVDASGDTVLSEGTAAILGLREPYGVIWVFNNVPYILRLENGHSTQAPQGMLRLTIAEFEAAP